MPRGNKKKIIGLLGVGFDAEDGHVRITKGEKHDVIMGSDASHEYLQKLIEKIEAELKDQDMKLDDLSPQEFSAFVQSIL
ncbi:MAG: hypothetical protein V3V05_04705 [Pontiella sp.]